MSDDEQDRDEASTARQRAGIATMNILDVFETPDGRDALERMTEAVLEMNRLLMEAGIPRTDALSGLVGGVISAIANE